MNLIKSWDNDFPKIIKPRFINRKIPKYLKSFNVDSLKELSLEQGNQFFVKIIQDFKNGKLTLDELSAFGFNIFHVIGKKHEKSDLFQASLSASELNFSTRAKEVFNNTPQFLSDVENFLIKYQ